MRERIKTAVMHDQVTVGYPLASAADGPRNSAQPLRHPEAEGSAHNRLQDIEGQNGNVEIRKHKRPQRQKEAPHQPGTGRSQDDWIFHHDGAPLSFLSRCSGIMQPVRSRSIATLRLGVREALSAGCRCAPEEGDEFAAVHSMTSSARATSMGGTSKPPSELVK
jgi:hypothetical protein